MINGAVCQRKNLFAADLASNRSRKLSDAYILAISLNSPPAGKSMNAVSFVASLKKLYILRGIQPKVKLVVEDDLNY